MRWPSVEQIAKSTRDALLSGSSCGNVRSFKRFLSTTRHALADRYRHIVNPLDDLHETCPDCTWINLRSRCAKGYDWSGQLGGEEWGSGKAMEKLVLGEKRCASVGIGYRVSSCPDSDLKCHKHEASSCC